MPLDGSAIKSGRWAFEVAMVSIRPNSHPDRQDKQTAQVALEKAPRRADLPTMYDLPSDDPEEPGLPDEFHDLQPQLLSRTLQLTQYARQQWFTGTDLNLYYDPQHPRWYKRPDWFLAVGVSRLYDGEDLRLSYVAWQEGKSPDVVVEFLSPGTAAEDLGRFVDQASQQDSGGEELEQEMETKRRPPGKLEVYESYLQVPHYIVYSRYTQRLRYFQRINGVYQEQVLRSENPFIWLEDLELGLGIWQGDFDGVQQNWLRWCDCQGNWLLTDTEQERSRADQAQSRADQAEQQIQELLELLRSRGIDPKGNQIEVD
jgi:Uma2 family endonuclease